MKKLRIGLFGATGKMGGEISALIQEDKDLELALSISRKTKLTNADAKKIDVLIDFSLPENLSRVLEFSKTHRLPLVSGVTGLSDQQLKDIRAAAKHAPILWSPNMSVGVAALKAALSVFADLNNFDFQIEEIHHSKKKDNPGGTALMLHAELERVTKRKSPTPIGLRGGGVIGVHKAYAFSQEEVLCFEHQALSRRLFARGALQAAKWMKNRKAGLYQMQDILVK